jgi:hypothetical protein
MEVFFQKLGKRLIQQAEGATREILLVAPFIKHDALDRILSSVSSECLVRVITRWQLREITSGASDLEIWELLREHDQRSLELLPSLHAKYYRFDEVCLAGSANLTGAALGWRDRPNLEFLARFRSEIASSFEDELTDCMKVTESIYRRYQKLLEDYKEVHPDVSDVGETYPFPTEEIEVGEIQEAEEEIADREGEHREWWIPALRHPEDLYRVYSSTEEEVASSTWDHGTHDLRYFDLPEGLGERRFETEISWQLLQKPVVQQIDEFVEVSKRFGAVRDFLRTLPCAENKHFEATRAWQTLMRWLLYFLGDRYRRYEANYSEIFVREE